MKSALKLFVSIFLPLILYGEQGNASLMLCDHDAPQHPPEQAGALDTHAEADASGSLPTIPCHNCTTVCPCHLLALVTHQHSPVNPFPSMDALSASSDLFADLHPLKVFRPPIS